MVRRSPRRSAFVFALLLGPMAQAATYLDLGWDYKRGDFGTGVEQRLQAGSVGLSHYGAHGWAVSALVPWLRLENSGGSVSGMGDGLLSVSRIDRRGPWSFGGGLLVKWPTGDASRGLGTGAADWAVQGALGHDLGSATRLLAQAGRTFAGGEYRDFSTWGLALFHHRGRSGWSLAYAWRGSSLAGVAAGEDLALSLYRRLNARWLGRLGAVKGLSAGSPDLSLGLGVSRRL